MTIKKKFQAIFIGLLIAMAFSCAANVWSVLSIDKVSEVENRRLASLRLADELRQSSDDLTRMARSFVATRDPRFKVYFQNILDIRSGKIPYPDGYNGIFWDFIIATNSQLNQDGQSVSLKERMKRLKFSSLEFAKIEEAEKNSDELARLETKAMKNLKIQSDGSSDTISFKGSPDQHLALSILFGQEYHSAKAKIMKPIQEFFDLLEERTSTEISTIRRQNETIVTFAFGAILAQPVP